MNKTLTAIFFEDYFVCTVKNEQGKIRVLEINGNTKSLLYFYVGDAKIINDQSAKDGYLAKDENVYSLYKSILKPNAKNDPTDGLIRHFITEIKEAYFGMYPGADKKAGVPLKLCFIPGIATSIKTAIKKYFQSLNFKVDAPEDYLAMLKTGLSKAYNLSNKSPLSAVELFFGNIQFYYWNNNGELEKQELKQSTNWTNVIIENFAKLMVDDAMRGGGYDKDQEPLLYEKDIKNCIPIAKAELEKFKYDRHKIDYGVVKLSNGYTKEIIIEKKELDKHRLGFYNKVRDEFEKFIKQRPNEKIFLTGDIIDSENFVSIFKLKFDEDYDSTKIETVKTDNVIGLLSESIFATVVIPSPIEEKPEEIKVPDQPVPKIIIDIEPEPVTPPTPPTPPITPPATIVPKHQRLLSDFIGRIKKKQVISVGVLVLLGLIIVIYMLLGHRKTQKPKPPIKEPIAIQKDSAKIPNTNSARYDAAFKLYSNQAYPEAFNDFKELALNWNDARSQCMLGNMYYEGHGVEQSFINALPWYQKAAEQNNAKALYALGLIYANGTGIPKNDTKAEFYLDQAIKYATDNETKAAAQAKLNTLNN